MPAETTVSLEQAHEWYLEYKRRHPKTCGDGYVVSSVACAVTTDGAHLRLVLSNGTHADFFFNAVLATVAERSLAMAGIDGGWMTERAAIMVQGPNGPKELTLEHMEQT